MSESKDDSTENPEKEPEVIFVNYNENISTNNGNLLLASREEALSQDENLEKDNSNENTSEIQEEIDSPDLVNIEDYKTKNSFVNSPENEEEQSTVVLCETTLESVLTPDINGVQKDGDDVNFFQVVNVDQNIIEDIPNEVLVYTCQPTNDNILNQYLCKTCNIVVGCIFCLKSHYESIHLNLGIIQYKCDQTTYLKNYTEICHKCNLVCESKEEMFEHRKIHFVTCDVCDMSFDSALFLSNHCKTAHEKFEVIISCDLCEQWFKQLQDLSDHYESYHGMTLCIVCFRRFATTTEMKLHHNTHKIVLKHTETVLPYACSKCNHAFAEISELSSHLTKDHPKKKVLIDKCVSMVNVTKAKKKSKGKREIKFNDCGGLTQEIIIVNEGKDKRTKRFKKEDN